MNIISIVDNVEATKRSYENLSRKFTTNGGAVFTLPTLNSIIMEVENDEEDGQPIYQGQKVKYYLREKQLPKT